MKPGAIGFFQPGASREMNEAMVVGLAMLHPCRSPVLEMVKYRNNRCWYDK